MWNKPTENQLNRIPKLYATENIPSKDKIIYLHFFIGGSDWYIAEYDPIERLFYGYTILNGDLEMAEWGYISFDELLVIRAGFVEVDREVNWKPIAVKQIHELTALFV